MTPHSRTDVLAAIEALRTVRNRVPSIVHDGIRDIPVHRIIDKQIEYLLFDDDIDDSDPDWLSLDNTTRDAIADAVNWRHGFVNYPPDLAWRRYIPKTT